jgi:hypothetical protein
VAFGKKAWAELGRWFPDARTEVRVLGAVADGTADVLSLGAMVAGPPAKPATIAILDWKTGWSMDEHEYQLMGYADAVRHQFGMPASGYITAIEVWTTHLEQRTRNLTEAQLDGFRARVQAQIDHAGRQYAPGGHCKFCHRQNACAARDDYVRGSVVALVPADGQQHPLTREQLAQYWDRSRVIRRALDAYERLIDDALDEGPIDLGDGRQLALTETEQDEIKPTRAASLLRSEGWTEDELELVLRASKSGLEAVVKDRVAKGGAAAEMRRLLGMLRAAGAVEKKTKHTKRIITL